MRWVSQGPRVLRRAFAAAACVGTGVSIAFIGLRPTDQAGNEDEKSLKPQITKWDDNWDRREPKCLVKPQKSDESNDDYNERLKKAKSTASRNLILIRHGQYEMGPSDDKNRVLTLLGREQADFTGKRLKEIPFTFDKLIHSTMTRATETASVILKHLPNDLPIEVTDSLREGAPYVPEPYVGHWRPEYYQFHTDGARIEAAFRKYFHRAKPEQEKDSYEIYVCHANVIRYFVCRALQLPPEAWLRLSLYHGSMTWVTIRPSGRVSLKTLGDAGFMPADKLTTS